MPPMCMHALAPRRERLCRTRRVGRCLCACVFRLRVPDEGSVQRQRSERRVGEQYSARTGSSGAACENSADKLHECVDCVRTVARSGSCPAN
eukprot:3275062-Pleurochrysis_carterae.AAC.1